MSGLPTIEIDLNDFREVVAAFEEAAGEATEAETIEEQFWDEIKVLKGQIEDARRMLTRADVSPAEALLYVERALVTVSNFGG